VGGVRLLAELGLQWQGSGEESEAELKQQRQWDASGMPVGCQWDANGMPMGCQWEGFWFKCKVFFAEICVRSHLAIPAVFFKYPLFFYYSFSFYFFFFLPSLLLSSGIFIAINPLIATYLRLLSNPSVCAHLVALPPDVPFRSSLPRTAPATTGFD